jgi:transcriptional regulator with XRE-family HTH domain
MPDSTSSDRGIRRRIIGLCMRRAREAANKTTQQLATFLDVPLATVKAYEAGTGKREPSLAELELIAHWLSVSPLSLLDQAMPHPPSPMPALDVAATLQLRNHVIGAQLKQARLDTGKGLKETADAADISIAKLKAYELGSVAVPITMLESLCAVLGTEVEWLLDSASGPIRAAQMQRDEQARFAALPNEVRAFVTDANAGAYLRMAMQMRDLPAGELRKVAEVLLQLSGGG